VDITDLPEAQIFDELIDKYENRKFEASKAIFMIAN